MELIDRILSRDEFDGKPPVLVDIGASGAIHPKWRRIAPYSVCIAFDADNREMGYTVREGSGFRKLYVYNSIVTADPMAEADFHFTRFPFCSSILEPDQESLDQWAFGELFRLERRERLKAATMSQVLQELRIEQVDWFKCDSQGTDLRLFRSLGEDRVQRVLAAEFETGIMDAYRGEDKLWHLLAYMGERPFWMARLDPRGSQRIGVTTLADRFTPLEKRFIHVLLKRSPGWAEVLYLNTCPAGAVWQGLREYLLGWVFAVIEEQHGFALELALRGGTRFQDPVFREMEDHAMRRIRQGWWRLPLFLARKAASQLAGRWRG